MDLLTGEAHLPGSFFKDFLKIYTHRRIPLHFLFFFWRGWGGSGKQSVNIVYLHFAAKVSMCAA